MRTKTLLLAATALAAGIGAASAQVYSQNVVGYINLTIKPGQNLITCQLKGTNYDAATGQSVNEALATATPALADGSLLYLWKPDNTGFQQALQWYAPTWYDQAFNVATNKIKVGDAFFVFSGDGATTPPDSTMTLVGEVFQGTNTITIPGGNLPTLVADSAPVSQDLSTVGLEPADGTLLYRYPAGGTGYAQALLGYAGTYPNCTWYDQAFTEVHPAPAVGEGFVLQTATGSDPATQWMRVFSVGP